LHRDVRHAGLISCETPDSCSCYRQPGAFDLGECSGLEHQRNGHRQLAKLAMAPLVRRRRQKSRRALPGLREKKHCEYEYVYELWIVSAAVCDPAAVSVIGPGDSTVEALRERLTTSVADVAADRVEGLIWKSADLCGQDALNLVADLPGIAQELAARPLGRAAEAVAVLAPAAVFGSQVAAAFVLEPVLGPAADILHGLELAGVLIGLVTGQGHLVVLCASHWLHDEVGGAMAAVGERLVKGLSDAPDAPTRKLKTVPGNSPESLSAMMPSRVTPSPESAELLADGRKVSESTSTVAAAGLAADPVSRLNHLASGMGSP
jgi:hypothetical protein